MPLDRFLSASLAGSSVSLNFKNWHHRICGDEGHQPPRLGPPWRAGGPGPSRQAHLDLLEAGGEPALLEGGSVVPDPLQQQQHQLPVLLPAQLQLLGASRAVRGCPSGARPAPDPRPALTLAFTPSCTSGTRGMASYREETYVMIDFSSG